MAVALLASAVVTMQPTQAAITAEVSISKSHTPNPVYVGNPVTYTLTVTNSGPFTANNVTVTDTLPTGFTSVTVSSTQGGCSAVPCNLGVLLFGGVAKVTITATPDPTAFPTAVTVNNQATVFADEFDPIIVNNFVTDPTPVRPRADLEIMKSITAGTYNVGDPVPYTLTVTNHGPSDAHNVTVTDPFPAGSTLVAGTFIPSQGTCTAFPCNLGTIASLGSATINYSLKYADDGTFKNTASVKGLEDDLVPGNNTSTAAVTVNGQANLGVTKSCSSPVLTPGSASCTVKVTNAGPNTARDVVATDTFNGTFTGTSSQSGCVGGAGSMICTTASIPSGGSVTYSYQIFVPAGTTGGNYSNSVTVTESATTPDPDTSNNTAMATFKVVDCRISGVNATHGLTLMGTSGDDVICGSNFADTINGLGGNDTIYGAGGNDTIVGGDGNDTINGGDGNDSIQGGAGNDILNGDAGNDSIMGGAGNDTIDGGTGTNTGTGGPGTDTCVNMPAGCAP